jgi:hypothetical protein
MIKMEARFRKTVPAEAQEQIRPFTRRSIFHRQPPLYFAARIGKESKEDVEMREANAKLASELGSRFRVFLPQADNPYGPLDRGSTMAHVDGEIIRHSKVVIARGGLRKDTAWECGYGSGLGKFQILLLKTKEEVEKHIEDWMLLLSYRYILVPKEFAYLIEQSPARPSDAEVVAFEEGQNIAELVWQLYRENKLLVRLANWAKQLFGGEKHDAA